MSDVRASERANEWNDRTAAANDTLLIRCQLESRHINRSPALSGLGNPQSHSIRTITRAWDLLLHVTSSDPVE